MTSPAEQQARLDGQMAALRDATASANLLSLNTANGRAWARGHGEITEAKPASSTGAPA